MQNQEDGKANKSGMQDASLFGDDETPELLSAYRRAGIRAGIRDQEFISGIAAGEWRVWHVLLCYIAVLLLTGIISTILSATDMPLEWQNIIAASSQETLTLLIPITFLRAYYGTPWQGMGIIRPRVNLLVLGILSGVLIYALIVLTSFVVAFVFPVTESQVVVQNLLSANNALVRGTYYFMFIILAPLAEELFFRSFLYPPLKKYLGKTAGIVLNGLIFGTMHLDLVRLLPIAAGGMALCLLYEKHGNLFVNIAAHAAWNAIAVMFILL